MDDGAERCISLVETSTSRRVDDRGGGCAIQLKFHEDVVCVCADDVQGGWGADGGVASGKVGYGGFEAGNFGGDLGVELGETGVGDADLVEDLLDAGWGLSAKGGVVAFEG